jgi:integrase
MASVTLSSYRTILDGIWRPELGALRFLDVRYSTLVRIADCTGWGKKTHNDAISVLRRAFKFGYCDHPDRADPTRKLKGARIQRKDRSLSLEDAETLIAALRRDWGDAQANYDQFRFFVGLRPSEEIALSAICAFEARCSINGNWHTPALSYWRSLSLRRAVNILRRLLAPSTANP